MVRRMALFDDIPRSNPAIMAHVEAMYSFLDRVGDPVFERIRQVLNAWFARYEALQPAKAANDLAARLRSKEPLQFDAAFWELYLHEAHVRLGFEVATHPEDEAHPDFVLTKDDRRLYLEATITGTTPGKSSGARSSAQILDWVNSAHDPNYFLVLEAIESGDATPRRREVTKPLEQWLQGHAEDWRALRDALERGEYVDPLRQRIEVRGWVLEFEAYPKSEKFRGDPSVPMIWSYPGQAAWEGESAAIVRGKVASKAKHYGDLDAPFVVALHDITPFASRGVMREALFGRDHPYWEESAGSANRVSAVLAASDFGMASPARKTPELWLNPYARYPLPSGLLPWPVVGEPAGSREAPPVDPAALFELPKDWPGKPFESRERGE